MTPNQALKQRLTDYKNHAQAVNSDTYKRCVGPIHEKPISWRQARLEWPLNKTRPAAIKKSDITRTLTSDKSKLFVYEFEKMPGYVDHVGAHEINHRLPPGWYCEVIGDSTIKAAVISIRCPQKLNPDNDSHIFYLAGTYSEDFDGVTIYTGKIFECQNSAAYYADRMAEKEAEQAKEADKKFQAEQRIEKLKGDYHELNTEGLALIKEIKQAASNFTPHICATLKNEVKRIVWDKTQIKVQIKALLANPGLIEEWSR